MMSRPVQSNLNFIWKKINILNIQSYDNGELIVFDTRGLNDKGETDVNSLQEMLLTFKKEKINALFLVFNGQVCRIDEAMKQVIRMTCKCFWENIFGSK